MKKFYYLLSAIFITVLAIGCSNKSSSQEPISAVVDHAEALKTLSIELNDYNLQYTLENPRAKSEGNSADLWVGLSWQGAIGAVAGAHRGLASAVVTGVVSSYVAYLGVIQSNSPEVLIPNISNSVFPNDQNNSAEIVGRLHNEILSELILEDENLKHINEDSAQIFNRVISILESKAVFTEFDLSLVRGSSALILSDISDIRRLNDGITSVDEATISRSVDHFAAKYPESVASFSISKSYLITAFSQGDVVSVRKYTEGYDKIIDGFDVSIDTKRELQAVSSTTKNTTKLWTPRQ